MSGKTDRALKGVPAENTAPREFVALDRAVITALAKHPRAAHLYGVLATRWYEFAGAQNRRPDGRAPRDWVEVSYSELQRECMTRSIDSVARWIRLLTEESWPCPWGQCERPHPLVVIRRGGCVANSFRKWMCGDDVAVPMRTPIRQPARRRAIVEQIPLEPPAVDDSSDHRRIDVLRPAADSPSDQRRPNPPVTGVVPIRLAEHSSSGHRRQEEEKDVKTTATSAAVEGADDVEAVACDVVDALIEFDGQGEPNYDPKRAWALARRLATATLDEAGGAAAAARQMLTDAIADQRLVRAENPVGLLIRGVIGDKQGADRFLLRRRAQPHREFTARSIATPSAAVSATPLVDALEARDPYAVSVALARHLETVELPTRPVPISRTLDHPIARIKCRKAFEIELQAGSEP